MENIHALQSTLIVIPSLSSYSIPFSYVKVTFYIFLKLVIEEYFDMLPTVGRLYYWLKQGIGGTT